MKLKNIVYIICCFCIRGQAKAQISFTSLRDVWAYADDHNIQLQAAEAGKATAALNVRQAYGAMLPTVSANGAFTDNVKIQPTLIPANLFNPAAPSGTYTEATFGRRYIYNGSINAQFDVVNTQDWFKAKAAKLNNEIASLNIAKTKSSLYEQLANAYYSYMLLSEAEKLSEDNLRTATTLYELANNKYNEGLVSEITLNNAMISKEKAEKGWNAAIENKALQMNSLKSLLGTRDSIVLTEYIQEVTPVIGNNAFAADPDVGLAGMQVRTARNEWQSAKAAFVPTLSAVYQYNTQVAADDLLKFGNSNTMPQQYWGLRLSVPVFSGNSRKYQVQKAKIDYHLKLAEYDDAKHQSDIGNQNLMVAYTGALYAYEKSKEILALYQSNDTHAARRLGEGFISLDERLKVRTDLTNNQNEYLQSMSDYLIQQYRLEIRQTNFIK